MEVRKSYLRVSTGIYRESGMKKHIVRIVPFAIIVILLIVPVIAGSDGQKLESLDSEVAVIPPSMTLLAGGARWAAQRGNSTLFINWRDNYLAHGNTDGVDWGPWPEEADMENWTLSIAYVLNETGLDVHFAGDMPNDLIGFDLLVIHAYWAVEPRQLAMVRDFIANGGGVVILSGIPEYFRSFCRDWWPYVCPTDDASLTMDEYFGCDGNYFNTGGFANVSIDNPFGSTLLAGDTLIEGAGYSNAAILNPREGSQIVALWGSPEMPEMPEIPGIPEIPEMNIAFAYTYEYGQGRVYYQATFVPLDPPARASSDLNNDGIVNMIDIATVAAAFKTKSGDARWNPIADLNQDNVVNIVDVATVAAAFNKQV
jgi:hypothetical protein